LPGKSIFFKLPEKKSKFFKNLRGKIDIFQTFALKNRNLLKICLEKSKFFKNLLGKMEFLCEIA